MVAFAIRTTRSWLTKLWPEKNKLIETKKNHNNQFKLEESSDQSSKFLNAIKDGGIWFS